jgi:hypothetical protein
MLEDHLLNEQINFVPKINRSSFTGLVYLYRVQQNFAGYMLRKSIFLFLKLIRPWMK